MKCPNLSSLPNLTTGKFTASPKVYTIPEPHEYPKVCAIHEGTATAQVYTIPEPPESPKVYTIHEPCEAV